MADTKISALNAVSAVVGGHEFALNDADIETKSCTAAQLKQYADDVCRPIRARDLYFDDANIPSYQLAVAAGDAPVRSVGFAVGQKAYAEILVGGVVTSTLAIDVYWYAASGTSGNCRWQARIKALTADTDTTDVETDTGYGTAADTQTAHLGTTGKRLHKTTISVTSLDSIAAGDVVWIELSRIAASASEMAGGGNVVMVHPRWA